MLEDSITEEFFSLAEEAKALPESFSPSSEEHKTSLETFASAFPSVDEHNSFVEEISSFELISQELLSEPVEPIESIEFPS